MQTTSNNIESQIQEVVRILTTRNGFPENSIQAELLVSIADEYEIRLLTYLFNTPFYTTIRLTGHMLYESRMGTAPMIIEYIEEAIRSLRSHILGSCNRRPQEGYTREPNGWEPIETNGFFGINRSVDPTRLAGPREYQIRFPNKSKNKEFLTWLKEQEEELKEGYDISMGDIIDKFEEIFYD